MKRMGKSAATRGPERLDKRLDYGSAAGWCLVPFCGMLLSNLLLSGMGSLAS